MNAPVGAPAPRTRPRYSDGEKLEIIRYVRSTSARAACERFNVARSSIYLWTTQESTLLNSFRAYHQVASATTPTADTGTCTPRGQPVSAPREPRARVGTTDVVRTGPSVPDGSTLTTTSAPRACSSCERSSSAPVDLPSTTTPAPEAAASSVLIGYQGAEYSFAHIAAQRTFAQALSTRDESITTFELTGYPQTSHVLDALRKQKIDFAFVATDVLLSNVHHAALSQMIAFRLKMVGEVVIEEDVNVRALPDTELCDADSVVSDWRTLQRYEEYVVHLEMQYNRIIYRQVAWDNAAGCSLVQDEQAEKTLVLCSASAATNHGLAILQGRLRGSPTHTRYTILGRYGTNPLVLKSAPRSVPTTAPGTLLIKGTARAILDIISAFAFRGLEILSFHTLGDEEQHLRSYIISYRTSTNPLVEIGLQHHLSAASERVVALGDFLTHTLSTTSTAS